MASLRQRGKSYQIQYYANGKQKRIGLGEIPLQLAKEKLRQFESAQARGDDNPLPTRTPIPDIVAAYVEHIRTVKTRVGPREQVHNVGTSSSRFGECGKTWPAAEPWPRRRAQTAVAPWEAQDVIVDRVGQV